MRSMVLLHLLAMFTAVALSYGTIALPWVAARALDVDGLPGESTAICRLPKAIPRTCANVVPGPCMSCVSSKVATTPATAAVPAAFRDRRAVTLVVADALVIVAIIADMVLKPF